MRGTWTAVRRILAPVAWNMASNEACREVRSAVTDEELDVLEPLVEGQGEVAGLLHRPLAGGVGGHAAKMHPAGAMLAFEPLRRDRSGDDRHVYRGVLRDWAGLARSALVAELRVASEVSSQPSCMLGFSVIPPTNLVQWRLPSAPCPDRHRR